MKHLKIDTIINGCGTLDNVLFQKGLNNFFMDLTRELLFSDNVDPAEDFYFELHDYYNSFSMDTDWTIGLTDGIYLHVTANIYAGNIEEEDREAGIEIEKIVLHTQDGSEINIDLSNGADEDNWDIANYILENITI
ncbi:hypothetical protein OAB94_01855 [Flavobacteriaceae bacterium]|nr:hypothetical protein [Flavobacteriaceae bacterium]MDB9980481.1 hypothetical protein [bacterium]